MDKTQPCPRCHKSCQLRISYQGDELISVSGHQCPQGVEFARSTLGSIKTTVSTSVRVEGGIYPLLPVRTDKPVDKAKAMEILKEAARVVVKAPIRNGQTVLRNVAGSGVDLIATRAADLA